MSGRKSRAKKKTGHSFFFAVATDPRALFQFIGVLFLKSLSNLEGDEWVPFLLARSSARLSLGKIDEAIEDASKAMNIEPDNPEVSYGVE